MTSKSINNLYYTGIVTLSQYDGKKRTPIVRLHNTGGNLLFEFLANCLVGNFDQAAKNQPTKIMLLKLVGESLNSGATINTADLTPVSGFIYLLTEPVRVGDGTSCTVRYSFSIASDFLTTKDFNCIGLYTNSVDAKTLDYKNNFVALCAIEQDELNALPASSRLIVDWELNISNNITKNVEAEIYVK